LNGIVNAGLRLMQDWFILGTFAEGYKKGE